jgi:hypothetical protein
MGAESGVNQHPCQGRNLSSLELLLNFVSSCSPLMFDALFDLSRAASKAFTIWARLRGDHLLIIDRPSGDSNPLDENT